MSSSETEAKFEIPESERESTGDGSRENPFAVAKKTVVTSSDIVLMIKEGVQLSWRDVDRFNHIYFKFDYGLFSVAKPLNYASHDDILFCAYDETPDDSSHDARAVTEFGSLAASLYTIITGNALHKFLS